ncbi:Fic family protein [Adlercreutzia muris]|jgi:hypothetical protein|uniref:Fic family protein n=1 Tax=Adlercreutzia muris TaxID=1796610 RepID=UPI001365693A|nr:Fic family protein [Adlercreutzia muris]NCA33275.1 cell filamentation protein Fic [Adlercreutzia muris]
MTANERLSLEDNIFLAKRNLVDSIWKEARLEGIAVTYSQTADVLEGRVVADLSLEQNLALNNLKQAWRYVLDEPHAIDFETLLHLNLLIGQGGVVRYAGELRDGLVRIGGTDFVPPVPDENQARSEFARILSVEEPVMRALLAFAWTCRSQLFRDGNKRAAQLVANDILVHSGEGILAVPIDAQGEFFELLVAFYESNIPDELISFLREKCIEKPAIGKASTRQS